MKASATDAFYNVGRGVKTSIKELAEVVLQITGSPLQIRYEPAGQTFVKNRVGCPKKAAAELGFKARVPLRAGLERLIQWRNSHKAEVERRRREVGL